MRQPVTMLLGVTAFLVLGAARFLESSVPRLAFALIGIGCALGLACFISAVRELWRKDRLVPILGGTVVTLLVIGLVPPSLPFELRVVFVVSSAFAAASMAGVMVWRLGKLAVRNQRERTSPS